MVDARDWNRLAWVLVVGTAIFGFGGLSSNPTGTISPTVSVGVTVQSAQGFEISKGIGQAGHYVIERAFVEK